MATIDYDNIQLNLTSAFNDKGAEEAIDNLGDIKKGLDNLDSGNVKEAAQDFRDFADAVNSVSTRSLDDIVKSAVQRSKVPRASSLTDDIVNNGATADIDDSYTSSASSWQQTADNIERAKRTLNDYKAIVSDIRAEEARNAEQRANTEAITNEWNEIGQAIDADISKTFSFRNAIAVTYDKLMDALGIYKKMPPTVDEIIAKMDELEKKTGGVGKEAKRALSPLEKLVQKFKNFMQYRAMRAVWSAFVNGVKEGFKNLEDWDRATGMTGFAESMDRARASLTVLKNSLAVVTAPFLEYLINILSRVASWAMTAANAISRMIAILSGKSSYRAVKWADAVADSQASAAGSAKKATQEFKKQLMAFDEINNLTAPSDSGSGGGGGGGGASAANEMFEERSVGEVGNVAKAFQAIIDKIKQVAKELDPVMKKLKNLASEIGIPAWEGFKRVLESVAGLFISIIDLSGSLVTAFVNIVSGVDKATQVFGGLKTIGLMVKDAFDKLSFIIDIVSAGIRTLSYVVEVAGYYFEHIGDVVGHFLNLLAGKESFEEFKSNLRSSADELQGRVKKAVNDLKYDLDRTFNHTYTLTTKWDEIINRTIHVNEVRTAIQGKGYRTNELYASGGFPTQGQMFIAREAGPELVGTIGGQTAVVNNSDIVASVSQGVAQAVASVLGGGQQVNVTLEGDAKNLFKVVQREGRAYSARTGQPALA